MHPVLRAFLRRTATGVVVIAVGVPMVQSQVLLSTRAQADGPALSVTGEVTGLSTDATGRLVLTVHNRGDVGAVVRRLTAVPQEQVPGCTITVTPWTGQLPVAAGAAATQALSVRVSGPRCTGARWQLDYAATA